MIRIFSISMMTLVFLATFAAPKAFAECTGTNPNHIFCSGTEHSCSIGGDGCYWDGSSCQGSRTDFRDCSQMGLSTAAHCNSFPGCTWRQPGPPPAQNYMIVFKNNCRRHGEIFTAVHYKDLDGNWVSNGFWALAYGETARAARTRNRIFYFHGHTANNAQVWSGDNTGTWTVRGQSLSFGKHTMAEGTSFGDYTFNYNCD